MMTAQMPERLRYQGKNMCMFTTPFAHYRPKAGPRPQFMFGNTALWRGYIGSWEIIDDRLYLIGLEGTLEDDVEASLAILFPETPDRVFADWFSGEIVIPQGEMVHYVHLGFASKYEGYLFLDVEKGVVVGTRSVQSSPKPRRRQFLEEFE